MNNIYSTITTIGIILVVFIHLIGYFSLMKWLSFSGIEKEAQRLFSKYGNIGPILLNASAIIVFSIFATIYYFNNINNTFQILSYLIMTAFLIRGISGYIFTIGRKTGSATTYWEIVFSSFSFIIGILAYLGLRGV